MAFSVTNIGTNFSTSSTACTITSVTVPAGAAIVVCWVDLNSTSLNATISDTASNTYTVISGTTGDVGANATNGHAGISYVASATALSSGTLTFTPRSSGGGSYTAFYVTGATSTPLDATVTATNNNGGSPSASPSVQCAAAPANANSLIIGMIAFRAGASNTFTQDSTHAAFATPPNRVTNTNNSGSVAGGNVVSSSRLTYQPTLGSSAAYNGGIIALIPGVSASVTLTGVSSTSSVGTVSPQVGIYTRPDLDLDFTTGTLPTAVALSRTGSARATYFNSSGTLSYAPINLAPQSAAPQSWGGTPVNVTITGNVTTSPDGTVNAASLVPTTTNGQHETNQGGITVTANTTYTASVYAKAAGYPRVTLLWCNSGFTTGVQCSYNLNTGTTTGLANVGTGSGAAASITSVGNGWYRCVLTGIIDSSSTSGRFAIYVDNGSGTNFAGDGTSGVYVWGGQVEIGSSASQFIYTLAVANGAPRYDYDPVALTLRGLLIEETRTNLWLQSADLSTTSNNPTPNDITKTANAGVAPDGTTTATNLVPTTTTGAHLAYRTVTGAASTTYTWSVYAKQNGYAFVQLALGNTGFPANINANFNLSTGTVVSTGSGATGSGIQSVGNGWYRCYVSGTSVSGTGVNYVANLTPYNGGSVTFAGDGVSGILAWGGQVEAGLFPTSYIPTTSGSVQRVNDVVTGSTGSWFTSSTNISLAADFTVAYRSLVASGVAPVIAEIDDSSSANLVEMRLNAGASPALQPAIFVSNVTTANVATSNTWTQNVAAKAAAAFSASVCNASLNGGTVAVATAPTGYPTGLNRIVIGSGRTVPLSGWVTRVKYWGQTLSNADLITVSTSGNNVGTGADAYVGTVSVEVDDTVSLTGVAGTASAGTPTPEVDDTVSLTGNAATSAIGTPITEVDHVLSGVETDSGITAPTSQIDGSVTLSGVSVTGSVGAPSTEIDSTLFGVSATGDIGTPSLSINANVSLTGVAATGNVGSPTLHIDTNITLTGVVTTDGLGSPSISASSSLQLTGLASPAAVGTPIAGISEFPAITGVAASPAVGPLSPTLLALAGQEAVASVGTPAAQSTSNLIIGVQTTSQTGNPLVISGPNTTNVNLTGLGLTLDAGAPAISIAALPIGAEADGAVGTTGTVIHAGGFAMTDLAVQDLPDLVDDFDVSLRWSDTEGQSWWMPVHRSIGAPGEYLTSPQWRRLGMSRRGRVFEISWSCPRPTALSGATVMFEDASS